MPKFRSIALILVSMATAVAIGVIALSADAAAPARDDRIEDRVPGTDGTDENAVPNQRAEEGQLRSNGGNSSAHPEETSQAPTTSRPDEAALSTRQIDSPATASEAFDLLRDKFGAVLADAIEGTKVASIPHDRSEE